MKQQAFIYHLSTKHAAERQYRSPTGLLLQSNGSSELQKCANNKTPKQESPISGRDYYIDSCPSLSSDTVILHISGTAQILKQADLVRDICTFHPYRNQLPILPVLPSERLRLSYLHKHSGRLLRTLDLNSEAHSAPLYCNYLRRALSNHNHSCAEKQRAARAVYRGRSLPPPYITANKSAAIFHGLPDGFVPLLAASGL